MADQIDIGLALSGGGYRAMLFNLGSLWRLNEMGWLRRLDMITSVSGGSILNGVLATNWRDLRWNDQGIALDFEQRIATPVRTLAGTTIDVFAGIEGLLSVTADISDKVADAYDRHLFHGARLQQAVPTFEKGKTPRFLFYATSLQTGSSVRIERKRLADYRIGEIPNPDLPMSQVVAASSAFPPILSPVELKVPSDGWRKLEGASLFERKEFKSTLLLTDGGVYDNMALEAIWERCGTVLVSDAGAPLLVDATPPREWTRQAIRVLDIVTEQTRALRRRALLQSFGQARGDCAHSASAKGTRGAYWGIKTRIDTYGVTSPLASDNAVTDSLRNVRTRLNKFTAQEQGRLINWGYALTDAAMRRYIDTSNLAAGKLPVGQFALSSAG